LPGIGWSLSDVYRWQRDLFQRVHKIELLSKSDSSYSVLVPELDAGRRIPSEVSNVSRFSDLYVVLLLLPLSALVGQTSPAPQLQSRPTAPSLPPPGGTDRLVTIDVQVTDKSGAAVRGLKKEDFTLLDDNQPKNIAAFHAVDSAEDPSTDPPVELVLVVDEVNVSYQTSVFERNELKKFLSQNSGKLALPTSLVIFTETETKMQNGFSRDGNAMAALYDKYTTRLRSGNVSSAGTYGSLQRLDKSVKTLISLIAYLGTLPGRKLMIWFSPGWPIISTENLEAYRKDQQHIFDLIVAATNGLRKARVTLYSIDPFGPGSSGGYRIADYKGFLKGVTWPSQAVLGNLALEVLAIHSGGRVLNSTNDLIAAIGECAMDAHAFYVLSFEGPRADQANEYHALDVTVDKPAITARTRTGYYAQP
jgi:VWFA-related protein